MTITLTDGGIGRETPYSSSAEHLVGELGPTLPVVRSISESTPRRNGNVPKSSRFDVLVARYYPAVYSFASRLTDDPREAIALARDAFNSTRKQLRSCCDDNVFASILISTVILAGLTAA